MANWLHIWVFQIIYIALYIHFYDAFDFIIISRTIIVLIPETSHFRVYIWKFKQQILEYTVTTFFLPDSEYGFLYNIGYHTKYQA